jgi:hypothetical protein
MDLIVDYTGGNVTIDLGRCGQEFDQAHITVRRGNRQHTKFQIAFRFVSSAACAACAIIFWIRLVRLAAFRFEQKLVLPLVILAIFYNDPFYIFHAYAPSRFYVVLDTIAVSAFLAYLRFFVLALFDGLRFKNREMDVTFFLPKAAVCLGLLLASLCHGIYDDVAVFGLPPSADRVEHILRLVELCANLMYLVYAIICIIHGLWEVDVTERYKFFVYSLGGGFLIFAWGLVHVLVDAFPRDFKNSSLRFVMGFSVENLFVLMMVALHWPYEVVHTKGLENTVQNEMGLEQDQRLDIVPDPDADQTNEIE